MVFHGVKFNLEKNISNHTPVPHGGIYSVNSGSKVIDFSSNVNPLGFPPSVRDVIKKNISLLSVYPDPNSSKLKADLEKYTGISRNQIVVGNGATEIIYNFCKSFIKKNSQIVIPIPTFGEYEAATRLHGGRIYHFQTMDLNQDLYSLQQIMTKKDCLFLCNPNNPTGVLMTQKNLKKIIEHAHDNSMLVFLDECFIELVPESNESMISHLKEFNNLFILRSLTKSFGLAGLRVGYGLGSKKIVDILSKIKIPWNVNGLAQKAASAVLSSKSHLAKTRKLIKKELHFLTKSISKMPAFSCYPSSTNFILVKSQINSKTIQKRLLEKNILVRDCSTFHGLDNTFIRIAVRTHKENVKLVKSLEAI
jgi:threonine-phosphate decarboxylase